MFKKKSTGQRVRALSTTFKHHVHYDHTVDTYFLYLEVSYEVNERFEELRRFNHPRVFAEQSADLRINFFHFTVTFSDALDFLESSVIECLKHVKEQLMYIILTTREGRTGKISSRGLEQAWLICQDQGLEKHRKLQARKLIRAD